MVPLPLFCHIQKNSSRVKNNETGMLKRITSIRAASEICTVAGYLINVHGVHCTQCTVYFRLCIAHTKGRTDVQYSRCNRTIASFMLITGTVLQNLEGKFLHGRLKIIRKYYCVIKLGYTSNFNFNLNLLNRGFLLSWGFTWELMPQNF